RDTDCARDTLGNGRSCPRDRGPATGDYGFKAGFAGSGVRGYFGGCNSVGAASSEDRRSAATERHWQRDSRGRFDQRLRRLLVLAGGGRVGWAIWGGGG